MQFKEQGLNTDLYYKNKEMGQTFNLVPTSAIRYSSHRPWFSSGRVTVGSKLFCVLSTKTKYLLTIILYVLIRVGKAFPICFFC